MADRVGSPPQEVSTEPSYGSQNSMDRATKEKLIMRKQVSFSSEPEDNMIITGARDCLCLMSSGSDFIKIKPGAREFQRQYVFDQETLSIKWEPSRKKDAKLRVDEIMNILMGQKTECFRTAEIEYPSSRCFSIVLRDGQTIDLVAVVPNEAYIWVTGLRYLVTGGLGQLSQEEERASPELDEEHRDTTEELRDQWLEEIYHAADLNQDGTLEHLEFLELMESLNKHLTTLHVLKKFKESELCKGGTTLSLEEFMAFFKQIVNRPEVHCVLARYATNNDYLSAEDLQLFLQAEQGMWDASVEYCNQVIQRYEPTSDGRENCYMTVDGFSSFLMSEDDATYHRIPLDKTAPITDYYVNSSYSSGSTGWPEPELSRNCYKVTLRGNFRCIRLEVWDGPEGPQVWHKKENTNRLPLHKVLSVISNNAFSECELPLIINLESHCTPNQQISMAKMFREVFGDKLFSSSTVPTLGDLSHKILIKARSDPANGVIDELESEDSEESDVELIANNTIRKRKKETGPLIGESQPQEIDNDLNMPVFFHCADSCSNYAVDFADWKVDRLVERNSSELIQHNREGYTFIHPHVLKKNIVSPLGQWQSGCQYVHIYNTQQDFTTMLNRSMFMQHGGKGFVLKPDILREECYHYSIDTRTHIAGIHPKHMNIRLISAQQLPKPEGSVSKVDTVDPYIVVRIIGIPADSHEYRTYAVKNDGFHPVWEEEVSFTILNPHCAFLHILMLDDEFIGDDYIGQVLIPLPMVKSGFRHLPLCSRDGSSLLPASVFVHIDIKDQLDIDIKKLLAPTKKRPLQLPKPELLRTTGVPSIDAKLKDNQQILDSISTLVTKYRASVMDFKSSSGLDVFAHVRHCLRLLDLRLQTSGCSLQIVEDKERALPKLSMQGALPGQATTKAIATFEAVEEAIHAIQSEGPKCIEQLKSLVAHFDIYRKDLLEYVDIHTGKKRLKALQNFSHNIWSLKEQEQLYVSTLEDKQRFIQHVYAHTGYKVKRSSWILKKTLSNSSTYSNKLNSISEARNSVEIIVDEETNGVEEVFDDGVLRPSTMEPTKTCLKRTTSPPATSSRYNTIFESADLESRDV